MNYLLESLLTLAILLGVLAIVLVPKASHRRSQEASRHRLFIAQHPFHRSNPNRWVSLYGTAEGAAKRRERYGEDVLKKLGSKGGKLSPGQFKQNDERTLEASRKGVIKRRGK